MSERASQQEKAQDFLKLHHTEGPFVLPNAWDVASAMIFVHEEFAAIGTTSAGIAASLGYADSQNMSFEENLEVIERIARCTDLPQSADCVFVPDTGNLGRNDIKSLVSEIKAPVNVIAGSTTPCLAELQDLGVARVSLGPRPMRAVLNVLKDIAREINTKGSFELMSKESISYDEINSWFGD